jgi:hypothetical protein
MVPHPSGARPNPVPAQPSTRKSQLKATKKPSSPSQRVNAESRRLTTQARVRCYVCRTSSDTFSGAWPVPLSHFSAAIRLKVSGGQATGERIFRTGVDRPIEIEIIVRDSSEGQFAFEGKQIVFTMTYDRQGMNSSSLKDEHGAVLGSAEQPLDQSISSQLNVEPFASAMRELNRAMYIGPFRNAINVGGQGPYYDIQTGDHFIRTFASYKSGPSPDQNEAVYDLIQEIKRIFGFEGLDINPADEYTVLQPLPLTSGTSASERPVS